MHNPVETPLSKDFISLLSELGPEKLAELVLSDKVSDTQVNDFFETYDPYVRESYDTRMSKRGLYPKTMTRLLREDARAYLEEQDAAGDTLLHCTGGLALFQNSNIALNGLTHYLALHFATKSDLERQNSNGATPLHQIMLSISSYDEQVTSHFIHAYFKKAAKTGANFTITDKHGANFLHYALSLCDKDMNHAWNLNASQTLMACFKEIPAQQQLLLLYQIYRDCSPMIYALSKGNGYAVKALIALHEIAKVPFDKATLQELKELGEICKGGRNTAIADDVSDQTLKDTSDVVDEALALHHSLNILP